MRPLHYPLMAIALLASCGGDHPTAPSLAPSQAPPQLGVAVFGVSTFGPTDVTLHTEAANDVGQVVGIRFVDPPITRLGWLYANGGVQDLPRGFDGTGAFDINAAGVIVGASGDQPAAWEGGRFFPLSSGYTSGRGHARAINNPGQIVGIESESDGSNPRPVLWESIADAAPAPLQSSTEGLTTPTAVNDAGLIVGTTQIGSNTQAEAWANAGTAPRPLLDFSGNSCRTSGGKNAVVGARDVNQLGAIVGFCEVSSGRHHAAYWSDKDATAVDLDPGSIEDSEANGINELGQIVGTIGGRPVLWVREGLGFRRFDLGIPSELDPAVNGGDVLAINNTGAAFGRAGLSLAVRWTVPIQAALDAVPGSATNQVKLDGRGRIKVAILGSRWLQVAGIDPLTLTLGNDDGQETAVASKKKNVPAVTLVDVNRDGRTDLLAEFEESGLMSNQDLVLGTTTVVLLGRFRDGAHLRGADLIQAVP
jgi:uncharacterized membrane protein